MFPLEKEQLGQLPAAGQEWRPRGAPVQVEDHSFFTAGPDVPLAVPYGVYDLTADAGWVNVGVDHDTSAFAIASIRRWRRHHCQLVLRSWLTNEVGRRARFQRCGIGPDAPSRTGRAVK